MIEWYDSEKLLIEFSVIPLIGIRYVLPSMDSETVKSVKKYPFVNKKNLEVKITDKKKKNTYQFTIPKNYCYDGASIPRVFWRIIGSNTDNNFLVAALIHDVLCENHGYVNNDRVFSTLVFDALLEVARVNKFKRFFMKNSVNFYQRFCKWK